MLAARQHMNERRKFRRYHPQCSLLAVSDQLVGQIINISKDGLAFRYVDKEHYARGHQQLLLIADNDFVLEGISVTIVSDAPTGDALPGSVFRLRQRGCTFDPMTPFQAKRLKKFIHRYGKAC